MLEKRVDKSTFFLTFYVNGKPYTEHIPTEIGKLEASLRTEYRKILDKFGTAHYYWHYQQYFTSKLKKSEDLLFMQHVYEEHEGDPKDKHEKKYFNKMVQLYGIEYYTLVAPKIALEKESKTATHDYALAYYKRWLAKPTPNMKRLYHGIDEYEVVEILQDIISIHKRERSKMRNKENYLLRKLRKNRTTKNC